MISLSQQEKIEGILWREKRFFSEDHWCAKAIFKMFHGIPNICIVDFKEFLRGERAKNLPRYVIDFLEKEYHESFGRKREA